jgi:hypothetical protein
LQYNPSAHAVGLPNAHASPAPPALVLELLEELLVLAPPPVPLEELLVLAPLEELLVLEPPPAPPADVVDVDDPPAPPGLPVPPWDEHALESRGTRSAAKARWVRFIAPTMSDRLADGEGQTRANSGRRDGRSPHRPALCVTWVPFASRR